VLKKSSPTRRNAKKGQPPTAAALSGPSFASLLKSVMVPSGPTAPASPAISPYAVLDYSVELKVKEEGLRLFWQHHRLPGRPEPLFASPKPRGYRTTSKRRASLQGKTLYLLFGDTSIGTQKRAFIESPLEPEADGRIYSFLQQKLSEPAYRLVAGHLNYLIIRGSLAERAVIFNVDTLSGPMVRKLKLLADHLQKLPQPATAAFVYHDPTRSDYYLENRRPGGLQFKKLFGPDLLTGSFGGCRYRFHPTSFSQVNESMVEPMLHKARELLAPAPDGRLLDLYCGYGLFSLFLAPHYQEVLGIDAGGPSIRAAATNGRLNPGGGRARFLAHRITGELLTEELPPPAKREAVLLDPPRQGPHPGVISAICRRRPQQILHIFCDVDQIPASMAAWQIGGYQVERIVPLDMFPGSANLEILILLAPKPGGADRSGNRKPTASTLKKSASRKTQQGARGKTKGLKG
jgi:tRNA/tmRNA/rRNA uracil-C5-methylase (TrmA/RlmC/RlmD family)